MHLILGNRRLTSTLAVYEPLPPDLTSGATYTEVPILLVMSPLSSLEPATFLSTASWPDVARPKSPILTLFKPSGVTAMKMFSGLRSRWTMFNPCIWTKPSRVWRNNLQTSSVSLYMFRAIKSRNVCRNKSTSDITAHPRSWRATYPLLAVFHRYVKHSPERPGTPPPMQVARVEFCDFVTCFRVFF